VIRDDIDHWLTTTFWRRNMPAAPPPIKRPTPKPSAPSPQVQTRTAKTFGIAAWDGAGEGQKVILYAASGRGKTTLASMAPAPVFIGLDDGGRMIRHPVTGEPVQHVPGVETFQDVRDALHQPGLFANAKSIVVDTGTALELLAMQWVIENVPHEKAGISIHRIEDFGYGKGYQHMFDTMRLFFADLDGQVRQGKNVIVLCQQCPQVIANAAGSNYLQDGPKLYAPGPDSKQSFTTRGYACEWADHVFKIDYLQQVVTGARIDDKTGKERAGKISGDTTRAIFTVPSDPSYFAKTRTLQDPVIAFSEASDDSLWRILFPAEYPA
jgi:hypothetical protein